MLADAEPVRGGVGCQATGLGGPGARSLPREQIGATLPGQVESRADGALEAVDQAGKLLGIDEVEICIGLEIANRSLELLEVPRHAGIISNKRTQRKPERH